jgi:hypothetical protein
LFIILDVLKKEGDGKSLIILKPDEVTILLTSFTAVILQNYLLLATSINN